MRIFWGEGGLPVSVLHCFLFFLCVYTWACILYHEVASDNPLGCCQHGQVGHVCSWGWGLMGFFLGSLHFMVEGRALNSGR